MLASSDELTPATGIKRAALAQAQTTGQTTIKFVAPVPLSLIMRR
ncbi:Unknown protein sequence [Pseudomonas amygdali pv. morsprunorum]|nr:Unknown protein sequence [Pseudomonas amygdali pv. morsprunorum]